MHFVEGIILLFFVILIVLLYTAGIYYSFLLLYRLVVEIVNKRPNLKIWKNVKINLKPNISKKVVVCIIVFITSMSVFIYINQREKWMESGSEHLNAKEYWVSGQVLYKYRMMMFSVLNPDNPICRPSNVMQRLIYFAGARHIPEDDGERGLWVYNWFVYPFSQNMSDTFMVSQESPSFRMRKVLDDAWFSISEVSDKQIKDKKMREHVFVQQFPYMAFYYSLKEGYYAKSKRGSRRLLAQDDRHIKRSYKLYSYLYGYLDSEKTNNNISSYFKENLESKATAQVAILMELTDIIEAMLIKRSLKCEDWYLEKYREIRNDILKNQISFFDSKIDNANKEILYYLVVETSIAKTSRYIISKICKKEIEGIEDLTKYMDYDDPLKMANIAIKSKYHTALSAIEEEQKIEN